MPIFKDEGFVPDDWRSLAPDEELPPGGKVILTLPQWQALRERPQSNGPLGLFIEPGLDLRSLAPDLSRFALLAVAFPKFTDGRGYSLAHQLRNAYGFAGELRASGEILFDQLLFLARCGFDSFNITDPATIRLLESGQRPRLGVFYQPGLGSKETPLGTRPWARRAAT